MSNIYTSVAFFILWSTLSILLQPAYSDPQVPCYFVFGDSLVDNGNNNNLQTLAKVNYPPYGIDYTNQIPTGRFSNGKNIMDVIAEKLGFEESVPSFASTATSMDEDIILKGVNYASGSAGIRNETGQHLGVNIPLDEQLGNHQTVVSRISDKLGNDYLSKCLYIINVGSNDYLNNYYGPEQDYSTKKQYTLDKYAEVLIERYSQQVQTLYEMGARKMALFGLGQLGCTPQAITKFATFGEICYNDMNEASKLFNKKLKKLVDDLNSKSTGIKFTCINMDVIVPISTVKTFLTHLWDLRKPCCEVRSDGQCKEGGNLCTNRKRHVFFDNFHPTEAINELSGKEAYSTINPFNVHPVDIRTLIKS